MNSLRHDWSCALRKALCWSTGLSPSHPYRFVGIEMRSVKFQDSLFEDCHFEDIRSTNTVFENCTIRSTLFYNTGGFSSGRRYMFQVFSIFTKIIHSFKLYLLRCLHFLEPNVWEKKKCEEICSFLHHFLLLFC